MNVLVLVVPAFVAAVITVLMWRGVKNTTESFFVAKRSIGSILGALSLAISWVWVTALFVGPLKTYQDGLPALVWFTVPNVLGIALSCAIAWQIRKRLNGQGTTICEYLGHTYDRSVRNVTIVGTFFIQGVYAVLLHLVGAQILLSAAIDLSPMIIVMILASLMVTLASFRGLFSSIGADVLKVSLVSVVVIASAVALYSAGSDTFMSGLAGVRGKQVDFFDPALLTGFAVPVALSLLASGAIDQQLYQRSYALSQRGAGWGLVLAPIIFMVLCVGIASLGFIAVGQGLKIDNAQFIGFEALKAVFPEGAGTLFILTIVAILIATGASALNAVSSVGAVDVVKSIVPTIGESLLIWISRGTMALFVVICVLIYSFFPKISLLDLVLFIGPFRVALMLPTIMGAYTRARVPTSRGFTYALIAAMGAGLLLAAGWVPLYSEPSTRVFFAGLTALGISAVACTVEWYRSRTLAW